MSESYQHFFQSLRLAVIRLNFRLRWCLIKRTLGFSNNSYSHWPSSFRITGSIHSRMIFNLSLLEGLLAVLVLISVQHNLFLSLSCPWLWRSSLVHHYLVWRWSLVPIIIQLLIHLHQDWLKLSFTAFIVNCFSSLSLAWWIYCCYVLLSPVSNSCEGWNKLNSSRCDWLRVSVRLDIETHFTFDAVINLSSMKPLKPLFLGILLVLFCVSSVKNYPQIIVSNATVWLSVFEIASWCIFMQTQIHILLLSLRS